MPQLGPKCLLVLFFNMLILHFECNVAFKEVGAI